MSFVRRWRLSMSVLTAAATTLALATAPASAAPVTTQVVIDDPAQYVNFGNVPFMPTVGASPVSYSTFSHTGESASPGYYSVAVGNGVRTELTTTQRGGVARFTYPAGQRASLSVDAAKAFNSASGSITVGTSRRTIEGKCVGKVLPSPKTAAQQSGVDTRKAGNQRGGVSANGSLVNPPSGRCPDVPNSITTNGTQLQLWDCNGTGAQTWQLITDP
jgi:hypothetical protein